MELIIYVIIAAISAAISYFVTVKLNSAKFDIYIEQAKAKAKVIEHEAEVILKDAQLRAKADYEREFKEAKKEYDGMFYQIEKKEKELNFHLESELKLIKQNKEEIKNSKNEIESLKEGLKNQKAVVEEKIAKAVKVLENASGLTIEEGKKLMLEKLKEDSRAEIASIFRKEYKIAEQNMQQEVNNILSNAVLS